jgi:hypothetical protein
VLTFEVWQSKQCLGFWHKQRLHMRRCLCSPSADRSFVSRRAINIAGMPLRIALRRRFFA